MTTEEHLDRLKEITRRQISDINALSSGGADDQKDDGWNCAQCLHHMVRVYELYQPRVERAVQTGRPGVSSKEFSNGRFGRRAIRDTKPDSSNNIRMKMKTFKFFEPDPNVKFESAKSQLIDYLNWQLEYMDKAKSVDIRKNRVTSAIKFISFRLGDAFEFLLAHNERHILQAQKSFAQ